jgi:Domain of unknown function (DUF4440)
MRDDAAIASLLAADDARYRATMASDVAALDALLTGDFTYTHNAGFIDHKAAYLERISSGVVRYSDGERVSADTRIHGDAGIMSGHMRMVANLLDGPVQLDNAFLAVWVRHGGVWRLAAWSSTTRQVDG